MGAKKESRMLTEAEMREVESFFIEKNIVKTELQKQAEKVQQVLRKALIQKHTETCGTCDFTFVPMYTQEGYGLCPNCDEEKIEAYKAKNEAV